MMLSKKGEAGAKGITMFVVFLFLIVLVAIFIFFALLGGKSKGSFAYSNYDVENYPKLLMENYDENITVFEKIIQDYKEDKVFSLDFRERMRKNIREDPKYIDKEVCLYMALRQLGQDEGGLMGNFEGAGNTFYWIALKKGQDGIVTDLAMAKDTSPMKRFQLDLNSGGIQKRFIIMSYKGDCNE